MGMLLCTPVLLFGHRAMVATYLFPGEVLMKAAIGHARRTGMVLKLSEETPAKRREMLSAVYAIFRGEVFHRSHVFRPCLINSSRGVHYEASSFSSHINDLFAILSHFLGRT